MALHITSCGIQCEIMCEHLEDVTKPSEVSDLQCFHSSNMSIAFLDSSVREPEGRMH